MGVLEKIIFESCKKAYNFIDKKADIWYKIHYGLTDYYDNLVKDLNVIHFHRAERTYDLGRIYVETKLLKKIFSERYVFLEMQSPGDVAANIPPQTYLQTIRDRNIASTDLYSFNELLQSNNKAIILGAPGAGKSTLLKHPAISMINNLDVLELQQ
jgi:hypothetical protein